MPPRRAPLLALACATLAALAARPSAAQPDPSNPGYCTDELGCSLLGACVSNACECDQGWTGSNCQNPDLLLEDDLEGFASTYFPTWGGMSTYAEGQWQFFGDYIEGECALSDYGTNGAMMRATGDFPWGPFTYQETVLPPFHHGVQVARAGDGSYLLFGDGKDMPASTVQRNCDVFTSGRRRAQEVGAEYDGRRRRLRTADDASDAGDADAGRPPQGLAKKKKKKATKSKHNGGGGGGGGTNLYPFGASPQDFHIAAQAATIDGDFDQAQTVIMRTDFSNGDYAWDCNVTNLSPWILPNGTVVMAFRSTKCAANNPDTACASTGCQNIGIAVSESGWQGPYVKRPDPIEPLANNEDPFLWQSSRGWHMLMHGKALCGSSQTDINTCGAMAYSLDSFTWYLSPWPAYTGVVGFSASSPVYAGPITLGLRQRPKITFDRYGAPMVLYNGVQLQSKPYVQNAAFRFNTGAVTDYQAPPPCPSTPPKLRTQCVATAGGEKRDEKMCAAMGAGNCVWCPNIRSCEWGASKAVCAAPIPSQYYAYC